jgi:TolA-binding protein
MSEEDLQKFIEEVVDEMIEAGELEAGHEGMEDEAGMEMKEPEMGAEEEVSAEEEVPMEEAKEDHSEKMKAMESELAEAIETIEVLKGELHEVNLLNSKLLYTNKIFKAKNLSEAQKVKVLTAFDKAESVKEVKLVFETLNEGLEKGAKKELVRESKGFASKPIGASPKQPVVDVNPVFERMKKLAGL